MATLENRPDEENDEFKKREEGEDGNESDDNFGLPDLDYQPIEREDPAPSEEESSTYETGETSTYSDEGYQQEEEYQEEEYQPGSYTPPKQESIAPKVITFIIILLLAGVGVWYFFFYSPGQKRLEQYNQLISQADGYFKSGKWDAAIAKYKDADKIRPEETYPDKRIKEARDQKQQEEEAMLAAAAQPEVQEEAEEIVEASTAEGTIETISSRTGKYYVVVASAIDGDLAMDYAKKLTGTGNNVKIISPFGNVLFHRVTIANHDTWAAAANNASSFKDQFGQGVWVIRY